MKKNLLMAVIALTLFSCSKNDADIPQETGDRSLAMSVLLGNPKPRSESSPAVDGTTINSLQVRVFTADGTLLNDVTIGSGTTPSLPDIISGALSDEDIKRIIVEKVQSTANYVEIRGYNSAVAPSWESLSSIDSKGVNSIQSYIFENIPFISTTGTNGKDNIDKTNVTNDNNRKIWKVSASIKPYFARFEVSGTPKLVNANDGTTPLSNVTLKVDAIYMNSVGNKTGNPIIKSNTGGNWEYTGTDISGTTGEWESSYYTELSEMFGDAPATGNVQAFNLWSQASMPHVIVKVTVSPDGKPSYTGYITIRNFSGGTGAIVNGNIYSVNLNDLKVRYDSTTGGGDIDPNPEDTDADLHLKVTVSPWTKIPLTPNM